MGKFLNFFHDTCATGLSWLVATLTAVPLSITGQFDSDLQTLTFVICADFITGILKGLIGKSDKTENGGLTSNYCRYGIIKKISIYIYVALGHWLDYYLKIDYIRTVVILAFIISECISLVENLTLITGKCPKCITQAIDIMKGKLNE